MNSAIKVGVIGVGRMGQYHAGIYSEMFDVRLEGVVDMDAARSQSVAERYKTAGYRDYKDLLGKVDIVSIAAPTNQHYEIAKTCLEAGVHCLVEKPITNSLEKAEELFELAGKKDLALHVGHVERFNGAVQELKKVVHDPIFIESRRMGPFDPRVKEDGVILDLMIHDIDILLNLVNSPLVDMNVMGSSVFTNKEDVVHVQLLFENSCIASVLASRTTQEKIRSMAITQEEEYVFLDFDHQEILVHRHSSSKHDLRKQELKYKQESIVERIFVHRDNPLKLELRHLIDCATNGAKRHTSVENELISLKVALQVLEKLNLTKKSLTIP